MSTIDTSTWNPDADLNVEIEGIPLNADAGIAQTWQALRILMAAVKGDGDAIKAMIDVMQGATASADGTSGLVPAPQAGDENKVLKGDGTWGTVADDSAVVHKTGDETIGGSKYFSSAVSANRFFCARHLGVKLGDTVSADTTAAFLVLGSDGYRMAEVEYSYRADGSVDVKLAARKNASQSSERVQIRVGYDANGNPYTFAPTPAAADDSSRIATTEWVRDATGDFACNAATAAKLKAAKTISLTGDVTGSASFDGSANASITATVADDSHNHVISNVDGLQTALDAKAADSGVVHNTGNEIIAGTKTFSNTVKSTTDGSWRHIQHKSLTRGTNPESQQLFWDTFSDKNGISSLDSFVTRAILIRTSGEVVYRTSVGRNVREDSWAMLEVVHKADGTKYATCPSTPATGNNNDIVTRNFIASDSRIVHTSGSENIAGAKTFSSNVTIETSAGTRILCAVSGNSTAAKNWRMWFGFGTSGNGGIYDDTRSKYILERTVTTGVLTLQAYPDSGGSTKSLVLKPDGTATWNGQAIQTSSDERLKTPLSAVPDAVLDAWGDVQWGQFQFLEAVQEKGESARLHLGLIAQRVKAAFEARGLDACEYGILCYEVCPATDVETVVVDAEAYTDEEGVEHPAATHVETSHEDAVDLWMVRYSEAQAMEAAYQRRRADRLEARIAALEEALK